MSIKSSKVPVLSGVLSYPLAQPEIYYKLQPDILQACDEMENQGITTPTSEQVQIMTDRIYNNVSRRYPDLAKLAQEYEKNQLATSYEQVEMFGIRIEQRGLFRGLIAFLLLSELFRRRRFRRIRRRIRRFI
jgi:hypothetical protein